MMQSGRHRAPTGAGRQRWYRRPGRSVRAAAVLASLTGVAACGPPPPTPLGSGQFAFGVFGDGPYYPWESGPWRRLRADAGDAGLTFFVHVGDILWAPCSDELYRQRLAEMEAMDVPVVYVPGDNEWTDCHGSREGGFDPLERLRSLRSVFFARPDSSSGARRMAVERQLDHPVHGSYPEHARWEWGGFHFVTLHLVGSGNGLEDFQGRTDAHDREVAARTSAALDWMADTFRRAREAGAPGVVVLAHGNPGFEGGQYRVGHEAFVEALTREVERFPGQVLFVHGDSHEQRVDHPLDGPGGEPLPNFTRLETFGSPEIGWVRVVVDSARGSIVEFQRRRMRGYW